MTNRYNSKETKESIVEASTKLFLQNGFEKTSIQEIAREAQVSKGAIYHHFDSKEDIIDEVIENQKKTMTRLLNGWISEAGTLNGKETLKFIIEKNINSIEAHSFDNNLKENIKSAEFVFLYMQNIINEDSKIIADIIKKGIQDQSIHTDFPDECAEVFLLMLNIWCDPQIFECDKNKLFSRLKFIQHFMVALGIDIFDDSLLDKTMNLLVKLYAIKEPVNE